MYEWSYIEKSRYLPIEHGNAKLLTTLWKLRLEKRNGTAIINYDNGIIYTCILVQNAVIQLNYINR